MDLDKIKIGLGGGCHWCTEAVFQCLKGVLKVEQGWVASKGRNSSFSEAVIVHYNESEISLNDLIEIHLYTHKSSSNHSLRWKYRSAIYAFSAEQEMQAKEILSNFQNQFEHNLITKVYSFENFKPSREAIRNYYQKNPEKPFCERYINPKLKLLLSKFSEHLNVDKAGHLI